MAIISWHMRDVAGLGESMRRSTGAIIDDSVPEVGFISLNLFLVIPM